MITFRIRIVIFLLLISLSASSQTIEDLTFGTDHTLEVATWNIENFPKYGQNTIDYVSQIIRKLDIDIIAFQEITDTVLFKQMLNNLPDYQYYCKSLWYGGLAFIYKTEVIQINNFYEIFTTSPYWSPFPRSPLVLDMNYMDQNIFVINNHLKCCGDGILDLNNSEDEETRRFIAMNLLKEYIDSNLQDKKVLVVGDFNDDIADSESDNVFINIINDNQNYLFADMDIAQGNSSQ
jgi:exonuclease III